MLKAHFFIKMPYAHATRQCLHIAVYSPLLTLRTQLLTHPVWLRLSSEIRPRFFSGMDSEISFFQMFFKSRNKLEQRNPRPYILFHGIYNVNPCRHKTIFNSYINQLGYNIHINKWSKIMSNNHSAEQVLKHFEAKPLSETALNILKSSAIQNVLSIETSDNFDLEDVFNFIHSTDVSSADFEEKFKSRFNQSLTPLETLEGESIERLEYLIFENYNDTLETVKAIIAEREIP